MQYKMANTITFILDGKILDGKIYSIYEPEKDDDSEFEDDFDEEELGYYYDVKENKYKIK